MTTQLETLLQHQQVCDELYQCVLDENRHLRQHMTATDAARLSLKQALLARLDEVLDAMRELPSGPTRVAEVTAQIEKGRARVLQILQLERENEQLLLRFCSAGPRPERVSAPAAKLLQRIYARNA